MAFSHWSTFGPKIKCWDSMTSAIAASTSALIVAYCALRLSKGTCILGFLFKLFLRLRALCQDARWSEKYVIFNHYARINGNVILNLDVISNNRPAIDIHILTDAAALSDSRAFHDMGKVPDFCAGTDFSSVIGVRGFVH